MSARVGPANSNASPPVAASSVRPKSSGTLRLRAFRHGHDAEPVTAHAALTDRIGHIFHVVRQFGDQHHVRAAGQSSPQRQPSPRCDPSVCTTMMR